MMYIVIRKLSPGPASRRLLGDIIATYDGRIVTAGPVAGFGLDVAMIVKASPEDAAKLSREPEILSVELDEPDPRGTD